MIPSAVSVQTIQTMYVTGMVVNQGDDVEVTVHTPGSDGLTRLASQIAGLQGQVMALCAQVDALCGVSAAAGQLRGEPVHAGR